jgi:enoyl-CoA hydratase/carnithine racemase
MVSAVNGYAGGSGFYLALRFADIVVAAESAVFHIAEVPRRILEGWQTGFMLGLSRAASFELAFGFRISGRRALEIGIANDLTTDENLMDVAMARATHIAAMPPDVIRYNIELRRRLDAIVPSDVAQRGSELRNTVADDPNAAEGDKAFLDKRT